MQAALQAHVDSSISKTINCPADLSFEAFKDVYLEAYDLGLKGCTTYRPNAVTGAVLSRSAPVKPAEVGPPGRACLGSEAAAEAARDAAAAGGSSLPERLGGGRLHDQAAGARARCSEGFTYKLRWPGSDHALYITINDIERDGHAGGVSSAHHAGGVSSTRRRPFEVFINTKNLEHYAWTVALTRMISAIFRRGGDVTFVVEELKAIFDPQGGQWMGGRYVPSLIAAIGEVIEGHMIRTGFFSAALPRRARTARACARRWRRATAPECRSLAPAGASARAAARARCTGARDAGYATPAAIPSAAEPQAGWVRDAGYSRRN